MEKKNELEELYDKLLSDLVATAVRLHDYLVDLHGSNGLAEDLIEVLRLFGLQNLDPVRFAVQLKKFTESGPRSRQSEKTEAKQGDQPKDEAVDKRKDREKSKEKSKEKSRDRIESQLSGEKRRSQLLPSLSKSTEKEKSELFRRVIEGLLNDGSLLSSVFSGLKSKSKNFVEKSQLEFNLRNLDGEHFNPSSKHPSANDSLDPRKGSNLPSKSIRLADAKVRSDNLFSTRFNPISKQDSGRAGEGKKRDDKTVDKGAVDKAVDRGAVDKGDGKEANKEKDFYSKLLRHLDDRLYPPISLPDSSGSAVTRTVSNQRSVELFDRNAISKLETILELKELKLQDDEEETKQRNRQANCFVLALRNESGMFCLLNGLLFAFIFYLLIKQPVDA